MLDRSYAFKTLCHTQDSVSTLSLSLSLFSHGLCVDLCLVGPATPRTNGLEFGEKPPLSSSREKDKKKKKIGLLE